jgi:prevent-host-death family protein
MADLTSITLREANQQFSELVRRVEETGEGYLVLRRGKPAVRILPADEGPRPLTPEQEAALKSFLTSGWPLGIKKFRRQDAYDDREDRIAVEPR